ncbi:MAG: hypothetical protein A3G49_04695 [Candidatus Sungbacteria bacterium RIFCSPLOWO2_12_FULL_41_11]|uniref:Uncharacterized protein n=1 Tax=Candidatus Sungbacteria bacterium RIFCSPLOWO2_12_FULL_41_11 TaxID=1802286 RepID=A0A1G2LNW6_9BACT|nr:MAG: hypothetical protein UV01_C0010G0075 [Parcubacteria group bacterium GW2011_GWA2_42_14]OGZ99292.1 MAG: hypothetical protein A3D41_02420 [Candidatus Sungbacteria bacterium RIFCSPHIGHO2_02_FULL_41_12b]OHA12579.1 MAG: hypothetical protein A3G49_04695 [Candidatus Sungbacteria bacterium RIFCSPLOWO2_12_FULL_41_11]
MEIGRIIITLVLAAIAGIWFGKRYSAYAGVGIAVSIASYILPVGPMVLILGPALSIFTLEMLKIHLNEMRKLHEERRQRLIKDIADEVKKNQEKNQEK